MRISRLLLATVVLGLACAFVPMAATAGPDRAHRHAARRAHRAHQLRRTARREHLAGPGSYRVRAVVTTRSARWTTVYVKIGNRAVRATWTARGRHAVVTALVPA